MLRQAEEESQVYARRAERDAERARQSLGHVGEVVTELAEVVGGLRLQLDRLGAQDRRGPCRPGDGRPARAGDRAPPLDPPPDETPAPAETAPPAERRRRAAATSARPGCSR